MKPIQSPTQGRKMIKEYEAKQEAKAVRDITADTRKKLKALREDRDNMTPMQYKKRTMNIIVKEYKALDKRAGKTKKTTARKIQKFNTLYGQIQRLTKQ